MNKTDEAIAVFTKLTEDYPELPEPYNNLAVLYASQKQYDKARMALEMAIRAHPSYATAYENLGDLYAKLASQAYGKAVQLDESERGGEAQSCPLAMRSDRACRPSHPAKPGRCRPDPGGLSAQSATQAPTNQPTLPGNTQ